jgi:WhiB family redox-sensing transcriptional regulator
MPTADDRTAESERNTPRLRAMTRHGNWRDQAACGDADPDLFFPIGTTGPVLRQIDDAKRICQACPARTPCLAWALDHHVAAGVWGGTTEEERHTLRKALVRERSRA